MEIKRGLNHLVFQHGHILICRVSRVKFCNKISKSRDCAVQFQIYFVFINRIVCRVAFPSNLLYVSRKRYVVDNIKWWSHVRIQYSYCIPWYTLINVAGYIHTVHGHFLISANPSSMPFCKTKRRLGRGKIVPQGQLPPFIRYWEIIALSSVSTLQRGLLNHISIY